MRGLLLESGNDAAVTLAEGVVRLAQGVRARDEPPRARSSASSNTHYANPIGLDQEGNYSSARDLVTLATVLRTNTFFKKVVDSPVGHAQDRRPPAHVPQPQPARARRYAGSTASRPATPAARATCSSARRSRNGIQLVSAVLGTPSEAARDGDTMALFDWALPALPAHPRGGRGPGHGQGADPLPPRRELKLVPARTVRRIVARGHRDAVTSTSTRRRSSRARSAAASSSGASRSARTARLVATRAAGRRRPPCPRRRSRRSAKSWAGRARTCSARIAVAGRYGPAGDAAAPRPRGGAPPRGPGAA